MGTKQLGRKVILRGTLLLGLAAMALGCDEEPTVIRAEQLAFLRQWQPPLFLHDVSARLGRTIAFDGGYYRYVFSDGTTIDYWVGPGPDPDTMEPGRGYPADIDVVVERSPGRPPKIIWPTALVECDARAILEALKADAGSDWGAGENFDTIYSAATTATRRK